MPFQLAGWTAAAKSDKSYKFLYTQLVLHSERHSWYTTDTFLTPVSRVKDAISGSVMKWRRQQVATKGEYHISIQL